VLNFILISTTFIFLNVQILTLKNTIKLLELKLDENNKEIIALLEKSTKTELPVLETSSLILESISKSDQLSLMAVVFFCATIFIYLYFGIKPTNIGDSGGSSTSPAVLTNTSTSLEASSTSNIEGSVFVDTVNNTIIGISNVSNITLSNTENSRTVLFNANFHQISSVPAGYSSTFDSSMTTLNGVVLNAPLTNVERQNAIRNIRDYFITQINAQPAQTNVNLPQLETLVTQGLIDNSDVVSIASDTVSVISNSI
jgi:hypothetical protein